MPRPVYRVNVAHPPRVKPLMVWDGDCRFCGKWIKRWEQATGGEVDYAPYQEVAERFPEIGEEGFQQAVYFIGLDGIAVRGAEAVFACLAFAGRYRMLQGLYERYDWFAAATSRLYQGVARNRMLFSRLTSLLWGSSVEYSSFRFSSALFQRGLGVIYLIAFLSFGMQMAGLVGSGGILPVAEHLDATRDYLATKPEAPSPMALMPSLLWLNASDGMLQCLVGGGVIAAILMIAGLVPGISALLCWVFYLSLVNAVPVFLSFQWDILLLEAGFLALLLVPWVRREKLRAPQEPSRLARWLVWWLLFRLMLESGIVKLLDYPGVPGNTWRDLTALNFHYFTQPIPNGRSWLIHHLPEGFHAISIGVMLLIELVVPFLIFCPSRLRGLAFIILAGFQLMIIATGNYGFFNLLTIVLCFLLIDDQMLPERVRKWLRPAPKQTSLQNALQPLGWARIPIAALFIFFGCMQLGESARWIEFSTKRSAEEGQQAPWMPLYHGLQRIHALNTYGLFRVMTTERPEIIIEGSDDLKTWKPYVFNYKAGPLDRPPPWVTPHMPRLDWQMWFAALSAERGRYPGWFKAFIAALAENRPDVTALLAENPFPENPPKYLRVSLYDYTFTTPEQRTATGDWWQRELLPEYTLQIQTARPESGQ